MVSAASPQYFAASVSAPGWARWLKPPSKSCSHGERHQSTASAACSTGDKCVTNYLEWWQGHNPAPAATPSPTKASVSLLCPRSTPHTVAACPAAPDTVGLCNGARSAHRSSCVCLGTVPSPAMALCWDSAAPIPARPMAGHECHPVPSPVPSAPAGAWAVQATPLCLGKSSGCSVPAPFVVC